MSRLGPTAMTAFARALASLSLLGVVSGCQSGPAANDPGGPPDPAPTSSSQSRSAPADDSEVTEVSLRLTGGLKPTFVNRVFSAQGRPPQGFTAADVETALDAAGRFAAADAELAPLPANTCCDRYTLTVTITRADGESTSYTTIDGLDQPASFEKLLSRLA